MAHLLTPHKGFALTIEYNKVGGDLFKKFIATKGETSFCAMTIKRLKLKINAHLEMPEFLANPSNFV